MGFFQGPPTPNPHTDWYVWRLSPNEPGLKKKIGVRSLYLTIRSVTERNVNFKDPYFFNNAFEAIAPKVTPPIVAPIVKPGKAGLDFTHKLRKTR